MTSLTIKRRDNKYTGGAVFAIGAKGVHFDITLHPISERARARMSNPPKRFSPGHYDYLEGRIEHCETLDELEAAIREVLEEHLARA